MMSKPGDAARYSRMIRRIEAAVAELNATLGCNTDLLASDDRVSFGYIGDDGDRLWCVFLPHPGRVGDRDDRLGGFVTGDLDGALATYRALAGFARGVTWAQARRG